MTMLTPIQILSGAGYLDVTDPEIIHKYEQHYHAILPKQKGYKIPEMYDAALSGKLKELWLMGEDLVQTDPNTHHVKAALSNLDLLVVHRTAACGAPR